ncbi:hypothetical protein D3C80_1225580 [compost metagenome]
MKLDLIQELVELTEDMARMPAPDRKLNSTSEFEQTIEEFSRRFDAARRALSIVNQLRDPEQKKKHASRVLTNMNVIRHYLNTLVRQLESMTQE